MSLLEWARNNETSTKILTKSGGDARNDLPSNSADSQPLLLSSALRGSNQDPATQHLPYAESVMNRVAINQDTAEAERAHYIYVQHAKMTSRRGNTVMCEELTDYRFTPSTDGTDEQLLKVDGRFLKDHKFISYSKLLPAR